MFLNDENIETTFVKESISDRGQREAVLVVKMTDDPNSLKLKDPENYKQLSQKLKYLNDLAQSGFLDFHRIEITKSATLH